MFKGFWKEFVLAAVLTALFFGLVDLLGDFVAAPEGSEITLSAGLLLLSLAILVLPALLGSIPSGYLIGKKKKGNEAMFVPAAGAAVGGLMIMLLSVLALLLMTDAEWMAQMQAVAEYGVSFFAGMTLEQYKATVIASSAIGIAFIAIINFAIGLAGGLIGSRLAAQKK